MNPTTRRIPGQDWVMALPSQLSATPHRMMFFGGATAVIGSILWWLGQLAAWRFGWPWPQPPIPAAFAHATLTQYGMLPMFVFGFLLTVFPRWMDQPPVSRPRYVLVFVGLFGGLILTDIGLLGYPALLRVGLGSIIIGWSIGLFTLIGIARRNRWIDRHARSCVAALLIGLIGVAMLLATAPGAVAWQSLVVRLGTFGFLLPIYFTVCHRMLPFFSKMAVRGYDVVRPAWSLPLAWLLLAVHVGMDTAQWTAWRWLVDVPLALFFLWHAVAWQPWKAVRPGLLAVLHLAFAWLPLAFVLFAAQSVGSLPSGDQLFGKAPTHALTIGFFGSMLVAMVTRVTAGHSGRPLTMGLVPWFTFITIQIVAIVRIAAELSQDRQLWLMIAAAGWLAAFAPWVVRAMWIYTTPRADGQPG